jgi:predicted GNAT family N-acyltransferase
VWAIARKAGNDLGRSPAQGFIATLPVTQLGLGQLVAGAFDGTNPDLAAVATQGEVPAAIYIWCVYAPGRLAGAIPLTIEQMSRPPYREADFIGRPNTADGVRLNEACGFKRGAVINGTRVNHLYVFERSYPAESNAPAYDTYRAGLGHRILSVTLARTHDDMTRIAAIRAIVYVAEQECPFDEEFDGNDLTAASHLIGYVGDEPGGCMRIRFFAGFAKFERMAVLPRFRHSRLSFHLVRAAIDLSRKKGYQIVYGHARRDLIAFWKRHGFRQIENAREFVFSGQSYVEMLANLEQDPDAIAIGANPYVLIRPEGRWHVPGVLERTANRGSVPEAAAS